MSTLKLSLLVTAVVTTLLPSAGFAMTTMDFDNMVLDGQALNITGRVLDGSIDSDVVRVQTYQTVADNGSVIWVPNQLRITHNKDALISHCKSSTLALGMDSSKCGSQSNGRTRQGF